MKPSSPRVWFALAGLVLVLSPAFSQPPYPGTIHEDPTTRFSRERCPRCGRFSPGNSVCPSCIAAAHEASRASDSGTGSGSSGTSPRSSGTDSGKPGGSGGRSGSGISAYQAGRVAGWVIGGVLLLGFLVLLVKVAGGSGSSRRKKRRRRRSY